MASNQMHRKDNTAEEKQVRLPETGKVNIKADSAPGVNIKAQSAPGVNVKAASGQGQPGSVAKFEVVVNAEAGAAGQDQKSRQGTRLSQGQGPMLSPGGQGQQEQQSRQGTRLSEGQGTRLSEGQGPMLSPGGEGQKPGSYGAQSESREKDKVGLGQQLGKNIGGEPEEKQKHEQQDNQAKAKRDITNRTAQEKSISVGQQQQQQSSDKAKEAKDQQKHEVKQQNIHAKAKQDMNKSGQGKSQQDDQGQRFGQHEVKQQDLHAKAKQDMNKSGQGKSQQDDQGQRLEVKQQDLHGKAKQDMNNKTSNQENSSQQKKTTYNKPGVSVVFHEHGDDQGKDSTREGEQKPTMPYAKANQSQQQKDSNKSRDATQGQQFGETKQTMQDIMPSLIVAEDRFAKAKQSQPQKDANKTIQGKQKPGVSEHDEQRHDDQAKHEQHDVKQQNLHAKAKQSQPQKDSNKSTQEKQKLGVSDHAKESQERRNIVVSEHGQKAEKPQDRRHGDQTKHEQHDVKQQNLHAKAKQSQPQKDTNKSTQEKQKPGVSEHDEKTKQSQEQWAKNPQEQRDGNQTKHEQHSVKQQNLHAKAKQSLPQKETNKSAQEKETTPKKQGASATEQGDQRKQSQEWNRAVVSGHGDQTKLQQKQKFGAEDGNDNAKQSQSQHDTNKKPQEKSMQQKDTISKKTSVSDRAKKPQDQGPGATAKHGNQLKQSKGNQRGVVNERDDEENRWEVLEPEIGEEAEIVTEGVMQAVGETIVDIAKTAKDFVIGQDQHGFPIAKDYEEEDNNNSRVQVRGQYDHERAARGVQLGGQYGQESVPEKEWGFQQGAKGFAGFSEEEGWQDSSMEVLEPTIGQQAQDGGVLQAIGETLVDIAKTTKDFVIGQDQPGADGAAKGFVPKDLEAREQYAKTNEDRWTVDGSAKGSAPKGSEVREQHSKTVKERWTVGG